MDLLGLLLDHALAAQEEEEEAINNGELEPQVSFSADSWITRTKGYRKKMVETRELGTKKGSRWGTRGCNGSP